MSVLRAIRAYRAANKISPTYDEIAAATRGQNKGSRSNAKRIVSILVRKGLLTKTRGRVRDIVITDAGLAEASKRLHKK